jgi:heterodisulfide reductase subunit A-like polyferredoxin
MVKMDTRAIEGEINRIRSLDLEELRHEWRQMYQGEPPRISRDLLVLALGYRRQEIEHGGLGKSTRRKLQTIAKALRTTGRVRPTPSLSLKQGARLVREWRGRTHTVTVTEDGFEYAGTSYPSLTKIAKKITGAHWSGPRFFGLPAAGAERTNSERRYG